jgi:hypothetical protein
MPTLISILRQKEKRIVTGEVVSKIADMEYTVRTENRELRVRAAIAEDLPEGVRVVLAHSDEGLYIVGKQALKNQTATEVVIDG